MLTGETEIDWLHRIDGLLPWLVLILAVAIGLITLVFTVLRLLDNRRLLNQKAVFLELTPPAQTDKTGEATQRLFSVLHGLESSRSLLDRLLRRSVVFTLEVVSSKEAGIRYVLRVAEDDTANFEQTVASYLPDAKVRHIDDFLSGQLSSRHVRLLEVKQTGHFAYPLNAQGLLEDHDSMAYLTGAMTKFTNDEMIAVQLVVSPVKVREANRIAGRILYNEELLHQLGRQRFPIVGKAFGAINSLLFGIVDGISDAFHGSSSQSYRTQQPNAQYKQQVAMKIKPARTLSQFEQKLAESVHDKVSQPLFRVNIRALVVVNSKQAEEQRVKGLRDWLALFNMRKYQSLSVRFNYPLQLQKRYRLFTFQHRLPSLFAGNSCVFSAAEVTDLYHFPHSQTGKTENVVKSLSKTLPAPISLKGKTDFDIILGQNIHHGTSTAIGLTAAERERHVYIIGGTGNGKTTMMLYAMIQDLKNGKGFAFIDPHGDAAETILRHVLEDRIEDVIYFNPDDLAYPIGLNLLELPPGLTGDELLREKDLVTESTVSVFRKIFSEDDSGGHRIEYVLRNAVQTALTIEGSTLFTIFRLLNDAKYRKKIVATLEDEDLKSFWKNELGRAGDFQRVKMSAGITAKVGRFLFSASAKRILEQAKSTIDFDSILNDGKILICNFSKGLLGEDTSELFGVTVLAKLQMAALRRARIKQAERRPFHLYVDEFQNFATMSFVQMLSEARKYKLFLTMAEQSTSQQEEQRMVNIILANVGTIICFRSGNPADELAILPMFSPYIEAGEIANLPAFSFFMRMAAIKAQEPLSGMTILGNDKGNELQARATIQASRYNYAIDYKMIEQTLSIAVQDRATIKKLRKKTIRALPGD